MSIQKTEPEQSSEPENHEEDKPLKLMRSI